MPKLKTAWTAERVARLSFLVGQGFAAKRVADDPLIARAAIDGRPALAGVLDLFPGRSIGQASPLGDDHRPRG
jgi:hypothetical protein